MPKLHLYQTGICKANILVSGFLINDFLPLGACFAQNQVTHIPFGYCTEYDQLSSYENHVYFEYYSFSIWDIIFLRAGGNNCPIRMFYIFRSTALVKKNFFTTPSYILEMLKNEIKRFIATMLWKNEPEAKLLK